MEVSSQLYAPAALSPGKESPVPLIGWVGPRTGLDNIEKWKFLTLQELQLRPHGRPARNLSLYRVSYCGSLMRRRSWSIPHFYIKVRKNGDYTIKIKFEVRRIGLPPTEISNVVIQFPTSFYPEQQTAGFGTIQQRLQRSNSQVSNWGWQRINWFNMSELTVIQPPIQPLNIWGKALRSHKLPPYQCDLNAAEFDWNSVTTRLVRTCRPKCF
jgi:hypothetical protein